MSYYVYILRCKDGSYYTGHAKDVEKRFEMHKKGRGAKYTRIHEPEKLVYLEEFESRGDAMKRERQIKTLSHNKKQQLINNNKGVPAEQSCEVSEPLERSDGKK